MGIFKYDVLRIPKALSNYEKNAKQPVVADLRSATTNNIGTSAVSVKQ